MKFRILAINIGSTSLKTGAFENKNELFREQISCYDQDIASRLSGYSDWFQFHRESLLQVLKKHEAKLEKLDMIVSRGAITRPIESGAYFINKAMVQDLRSSSYGWHPSNVGPEIALKIAERFGTDAIIYDSPSTDEMDDLARVSGLKGIQRRAAHHVLNQKAAAKKAATKLGKEYTDTCLVVAHLGGGITVSAHRYGRIMDGTHGLSEGPFTPQRTGSLPLLDLINLCFSREYSRHELERKLLSRGGIFSYLGTHDIKEVETKVLKSDSYAHLILRAMAYQISKEIGSMATSLKGKVDAVVLTGNLSRSKMLIGEIKERVNFIAPVMVFPGEEELEALVNGALDVLRGKEKIKVY